MQEIETDVIIIGGGLTGLSLAYKLGGYNIRCIILEARERLGGRILTQKKNGGAPLEMGATWIGSNEELMLKYLDDLEIETFKQEMGKSAFYEAGHGEPTQLVRLPKSDLDSLRIKNGTSQIIEVLHDNIPKEKVYLRQQVKCLENRDGFIDTKSATHSFRSKMVVSTVPPRLFMQNIDVTPQLPSEIKEVGLSTHTWMGTSIKVAITYSKKFWSEEKLSGTIFSNIGPITEMYDHSNFEDSKFALKGFLHDTCVTLTKEDRIKAVLSQLERYFGADARDILSYEELLWSREEFTLSSVEINSPRQNNGHEVYLKSYLDGKLLFAGTETSKLNSGHMEGAINSSNRVYKHIIKQLLPD